MPKLVVLGDSLVVKGYNVPEEQTWPKLLEKHDGLAALSVDVFGRGGLTAADHDETTGDAKYVGRAPQFLQALHCDADFVIIALGRFETLAAFDGSP
jgi:hypothetical protein